jgi:hypothetical protein
MGSGQKARVKDNGKDHMQDLVKSIVDTLWSYDSVKRVVNNNYVVLSAMVRNTIKSLGINADNFDYESFMDNFDVHELDTNDKSTFIDSLSKLLSKFIVNKVDNNVDIAMEKAPYEIESRLREILNYLKSNPNDNETVDYAKELIQELKEFNRELARKYEIEIENIINPKPKVVEPKPVVRVMSKPEPKVDDNNVLKPVTERRLRQIRSYERLRPKLRELREETARALEELRKQREAEIYSIEVVLFEVFRTLRDSRESKYWNENIELAKSEIERLRKLDPERADRYERELQEILSEIERNREPKARVHVNRGKIIAYIPIEPKVNVNDVNAVDAVDVSEILKPSSPKPRSVKTDVKTTVKRKPGLLRLMNAIGKDFVNMYYYRGRY